MPYYVIIDNKCNFLEVNEFPNPETLDKYLRITYPVRMYYQEVDDEKEIEKIRERIKREHERTINMIFDEVGWNS